MQHRNPIAGILFLFFAVPASANEAHVEAAAAAYTDLDFELCIEEAALSLESPAPRNDRVNAYRLLGLCRAALGELETARDAFTAMLAIDAEATLPDGLSPRFTSAFAEAKGALMDRPKLGIKLEGEHPDGTRRVLEIQVTDPLSLIDRVAWRDADGALSPGLKAAPRMEVPVPEEVATHLVGLDENDGTVFELDIRPGAEMTPDSTPESVATAEPSAADESDHTVLVASAAGAAIVVGAVAASAAVITLAMFYEPGRVDLRGTARFQE